MQPARQAHPLASVLAQLSSPDPFHGDTSTERGWEMGVGSWYKSPTPNSHLLSPNKIAPARRADEGNLLVVPPQLRRSPWAGQRPSCPLTGAGRRSLLA